VRHPETAGIAFSAGFRDISEILQRYFRDTSEIFQRYFRDISEIFQRYFRDIYLEYR
jgi:hypothetical protein